MKKEEWYFNPTNVIIIITLLFCSITSFYFGVCRADNHEMLGQYGDFLGGILNPLFSALSLIVLVVFVKDIEHQRAKESIKAQQLLTKTQMRFEVVKELRKDLKYDKNDTPRIKGNKIINAGTYVSDFIISNSFLFPDLISSEVRETVLKSFQNSTKNYIDFFNDWQKTNVIDSDKENDLFNKYAISQQMLLGIIEKYIIDKLEKEIN